MKSNTQQIKSLLNQALSNAPNDFSLQEVKVHIRRALMIIESVENKREFREEKRVQRKLTGSATGTDLNSVLNIIEKEMNAEKIKLEQIKSKKNAAKIADQEDQNGLDYVMG